jgi:hypothetical protein
MIFQHKSNESILIGTSVPLPPWEGVILSVFSKAINILHPHGFFVSLVKDKSQMSSLSILVTEYFRDNIRKGGNIFKKIEPGTKAIFSSGKLTVGDFTFELVNGQPWDGSLSLDDVKDFAFQKLPLFGQALLSAGKSEGFVGILRSEEKTNRFVKKYCSILESIRVSNLENNEKILMGLSPLVGLGIGLTPSGDDFLSGVFLGERILSLLLISNPKKVEEETGKRCPLRVEKNEILASLAKTTFAGRTLLLQALRGQFPAFILKLVNRMARSSGFDEMMESVSEAGRHGETSGIDVAVGFFGFVNYFWKMGFC